jgi:hypothetical protein
VGALTPAHHRIVGEQDLRRLALRRGETVHLGPDPLGDRDVPAFPDVHPPIPAYGHRSANLV